MKGKVFGIGFSKTGTTSLEKALEMLGYNVCRGNWKTNHSYYLFALFVHRDYEEILKLTEYWDAFADAPWGGTDLYRIICERIPGSKFILTVRNPESWYRSFENLITKFDKNLETALESYHAQRFGSAYFFRHLFHIETMSGSRQTIIENFNAHNAAAREFFADKPDRFLELDITKGEGWHTLCSFLGKDVPDRQFPHLNPTDKKMILKKKSNRGDLLSKVTTYFSKIR